MSAFLIDSVIGMGKEAIKRIWPNPADRFKHEIELKKLAQAGDLEVLKAHVSLLVEQAKTNQIDAQSGRFWQSGWRPGIGWLCGAIFAYAYLLYPLIMWVWIYNGLDPVNAPPPISAGEIMPVLMGMLGLGGIRSFDKLKGTDTK